MGSICTGYSQFIVFYKKRTSCNKAICSSSLSVFYHSHHSQNWGLENSLLCLFLEE